MLDEKLRWVMSGVRQDWSLKKCLMDSSYLPEFIPDIPEFVSSLFGIRVQIPITNIYPPDNALVPHRDTSDSSPWVLGTVLVGCKALFIAGVGDEERVVVMARSGAVVVMRGESGLAFSAYNCWQNSF